MASKRSRSPDNDESLRSPERSHSGPFKRQRRNGPSILPSSTSVNRIKSKLRDVKRVLERSKNLPADIRIEKERALAGYRLDLENAEKEKKKQQMIKKYHMVRFFERQKATRKLKRLKKSLSNTERGSEEYLDLKNKVHGAQVDLNYTLYCPLGEKYTSLYKHKESLENSEVTMVEGSTITQDSSSGSLKPAMWTVVEQCMADNTLEALREGKMQSSFHAGDDASQLLGKTRDSRPSQKAKPKRATTKHSNAVSIAAQNEESDDGFFDE